MTPTTPSDPPDPPLTRPWRRRLRIAWSVVFGVLTVALCVLWVRSYWWTDSLTGVLTSNKAYGCTSLAGFLKVGIFIPVRKMDGSFNFKSRPVITSVYAKLLSDNSGQLLGFLPGLRYTGYQGRFVVSAPYWLLSLLSGALAALPWLPFSIRFSLRTMLIATTLIALMLGAVVWWMGR